VGTGPYAFSSWVSGSEITLVKNEYWWGDAATQLFDKVVYNVISDFTATALAAQSGQLDYVHGISSDTYSIYYGISAMTFTDYPSTNSRYLALNTAKAPMNDVNLRKAVAYAIDKEAISRSIGGEYANTSGGVPMPDSMFYLDEAAWKTADNETIESYAYNPEKAKEHLAASAYADGVTLNIYTSTASINKQTAESVQAMLKEVGIAANVVEIQPSETYGIGYGYTLDDNGDRLYDIYVTGWISDYLDPIGYLTPFWSNVNIREGGSNQAVYDSAAVQALIDQSYLESDDQVRSDLMIEAFTKAAADCPYVTLYDINETYALNNAYVYEEGPAFFWNFDLTDFRLA
jgi:peptide/nickel transport system substrate-binding protein